LWVLLNEPTKSRSLRASYKFSEVTSAENAEGNEFTRPSRIRQRAASADTQLNETEQPETVRFT